MANLYLYYMATKNALITIRNRRCELKLTFQYADHIMNNFINDNAIHPLNFLQIQKVAKSCKFTHAYKRIYFGRANFSGNNFQVVVILEQHNAIIKTCYKI